MKVDCKRSCLIRKRQWVTDQRVERGRKLSLLKKHLTERLNDWKVTVAVEREARGGKCFQAKESTCNKRPSGEDLKECVPGTQGTSERMTLRQMVSRAMPFSPPCANSHYLWRTVQRLSFIITCSLSSVPQHVSVLWISKAIFLCITHSKTLLDTVSYFHFLDCLHYIWFSTQLVPREFWSCLTFISLPLASGTHRGL